MSGYNGQRTNQSLATGPTTLPTFQQVIANTPAPFHWIDPDGSLIFFDSGSGYLGSFTSAGVQRWQTTIPVYGNSYPGTDLVIGPNGIIYSIEPNTVWAWNNQTGAAVWPAPVNIPNSGDERSSGITDNAGNLYINTGANYVGVPQQVTSISPNGTINWQASLYGRGYFSPVLSTDETIVYIEQLGCDYYCGAGYINGIVTATGADNYQTGTINSIDLFAPWGVLYGQDHYNNLFGCTEDLSSCTSTPALPSTVVAATNIAITGLNGSIQALTTQGVQLWAKTEPYSAVISDVAGTLYVIAPNTNDVVAINSGTGAELWRNTFPTTQSVSQVLLGDDGNLYVTAGTSVYKGAATTTGTISVTTNLAARGESK